MIDLRSDTITLPTPPMKEAMAQAELGDDVYGSDPTVNALEKRVAEIMGKEAAVYMPSGTMTNQVALRVHTEPGDEIFIEENAHIYYYEGGASAALSGALCRMIRGDRGVFGAEELRSLFRPVDVHHPKSKLVCVENTTNRGGGKVWPLQQLAEVADSARENNLSMHLDGARIWNAAVSQGVSEQEIAQYFDSVSVCFSKGLGAPVGSALVGSHEFIEQARRYRKQFGGGMRQAGIIAAGALYALDHHRERLIEDHENAKFLAQGLEDIPGIGIQADEVETNIVNLEILSHSAYELQNRLAQKDVLVGVRDENTIRAVTNLMVNKEQMSEVIDSLRVCMMARFI